MAGIQQPVLNWHRPTQPWKTSEKSTRLYEGVKWTPADLQHNILTFWFLDIELSGVWWSVSGHNNDQWRCNTTQFNFAVKLKKKRIVSENLPSQANC